MRELVRMCARGLQRAQVLERVSRGALTLVSDIPPGPPLKSYARRRVLARQHVSHILQAYLETPPAPSEGTLLVGCASRFI